VYLEEDADATKFVKLWTHLTGSKPVFDERITDKRSPIRSYEGILE
jgi:hypothetical protein